MVQEISLGRADHRDERVQPGRPNKLIIEISCVQVPSEHKLLAVVQAQDSLRLGFGLGQGGEEQAGQNGDDRDDHQKFNEREASR